MTKLEWCRANAPEALKEEDDETILEMMSSSYERYCNQEKETLIECSIVNEINNYLDYMVQELANVFGTKLTFKGGYMLTKLMASRARQTTDIDFSILHEEVYTEIKSKLREIAEHFVSLNIIDTYKIKEEIKPQMSGGVDMYKNGQKILGVDVGWHDTTYGTIIKDLDVATVQSFSIERMLADKITAILSRKRFRRPKDLYDLFSITECFTFDAKKISDYILRRGSPVDWQNYPFTDEVLEQYEKAYNKLNLTSIYKGGSLSKPDFNFTYSRFCVVAEKVRDLDDGTVWDPVGHYFK